ncbi:hypothetical protein QUC31_010244 [Theobroma cacao]
MTQEVNNFCLVNVDAGADKWEVNNVVIFFSLYDDVKRKLDPDCYLAVVEHLKVDPASCIFIYDRIKNVDAAVGVGITGLHFKNPDLLRQDHVRLGVDISIDGHVSISLSLQKDRHSDI